MRSHGKARGLGTPSPEGSPSLGTKVSCLSPACAGRDPRLPARGPTSCTPMLRTVCAARAALSGGWHSHHTHAHTRSPGTRSPTPQMGQGPDSQALSCWYLGEGRAGCSPLLPLLGPAAGAPHSGPTWLSSNLRGVGAAPSLALRWAVLLPRTPHFWVGSRPQASLGGVRPGGGLCPPGLMPHRLG